MSNQSQKQNMQKLAALSRKDLGYIYDDSNGDGGKPAGDKKVWLNTGKAFLRTLATDIGLKEFKVSANPGGVAVNGESTLIGLWEDGSGIYIQLCEALCGCGCVLYRTVSHMKDYSSGRNQWMTSSDFQRCEYTEFMKAMMAVRKIAA